MRSQTIREIWTGNREKCYLVVDVRPESREYLAFPIPADSTIDQSEKFFPEVVEFDKVTEALSNEYIDSDENGFINAKRIPQPKNPRKISRREWLDSMWEFDKFEKLLREIAFPEFMKLSEEGFTMNPDWQVNWQAALFEKVKGRSDMRALIQHEMAGLSAHIRGILREAAERAGRLWVG